MLLEETRRGYRKALQGEHTKLTFLLTTARGKDIKLLYVLYPISEIFQNLAFVAAN